MEQFDISAAEKRKSLLLTIVIYAFLLLLLFFIRFWPPTNPETLAMLGGGGGGGGVTINFGDSDVGMGDNYQSEVLNVKNDVKQVAATSAQEEDIISSDTPEDNAVVIPKNPNPVKTKPVVKTDPKPVEVKKPTVSKNTNDALANLMNGSKKGGDGDDNQAGNKGKSNGDLASNGYYGSGGSGGGTGGGNGTGNGTGTGPGSGSGSGGGNGSGHGLGNGAGYSLGNRKALSKPSPNYNCNEEGKVVVEVSVDKSGKTISATPGIKGTTNTAKCLLDQARIAAMNTRWQASEDAPERQVGKIIYSFSLN
ncbi:energy transducer TonB [Flavobacterium sp. SM15]|uniref:energy transducer TonB n=1 Tax=Flavobacterium sp. SM15 TaxID=2908005 RepID=UPI001EDAF4F7|nr:energy transducer TonB [Flavobacterium sp. SM15]MCG2611404.1 energy transducer TonB [Flavobacterium sp. SM15]